MWVASCVLIPSFKKAQGWLQKCLYTLYLKQKPLVRAVTFVPIF